MAITVEEFKQLAKNRKIYVFSTNLEGTGFVKVFKRLGLAVGGFIDSRIFSKYEKCDVPIIHPDNFFASMTEDAVVIIVAKHRQTRKWAIEQCEINGLHHNKTYFVSTDLCDYFPTIEIAGKCNLRCITCNMGVPSANQGGGYMRAEDYRAVLEKMKCEIPFLNSVYMYTWGEPLLNPQIDEIISITSELGIAGEISTNLVIDPAIIEKTIKANPDFLVVPCSGVGERFERTRTGGKWELFHSNLYKLREYIDLYGVETTVRIHYHMYRDNLDEDYEAIEKLCNELNFQFIPILAQIFPEYVLRNVLYNQPIPEQMLEADKLLYFSMENQLKYAKANKDKSCFMIKVFPVIRWDRTVIQCSNLSFPVVAPDYLKTPLNDLLAERERNGFCSKCMDEGMHRFFDVSSSVKTIDGRRVIERD